MHRDEDEAWRSIVENYGDRALIGPEDEAPPEPDRAPHPLHEPHGPASSYGIEEDVDPDDLVPADEEFVPPDPDPFPLPPPDRLAAWFGVLGSPLVLLFCVAFSVALPGWVTLVLIGGFIGGFLYLVARLPSGRDPWDDGARL